VPDLLNDVSIGLEQIGRRAAMILAAELNPEIDAVQAAWAVDDQAYALALQRRYDPLIVEPVSLKNIHYGARPSIIEAGREGFPNVSVLAWQATPAQGSEQADQYDVYAAQLFVEVMVRANEEDTCNARCSRTMEAVHAVMMRHRTLDGLVRYLASTPNALISDMFPRKAEKGAGDLWWMQGARLEYTIEKIAPYV
jgi:hypothetical protein